MLKTLDEGFSGFIFFRNGSHGPGSILLKTRRGVGGGGSGVGAFFIITCNKAY